MPATDTVDFEREFAELVRELRALPSEAPAELREHVRALGEPDPRRVFRFPHVPRRMVLALAPACVVALVGAAAIHGVLSSGGSKHALPPTVTSAQPNTNRSAVSKATHRGVTFGATVGGSNVLALPAFPTPASGRYVNYQGTLRVRVKDLDALGRETSQAMQLAQQLGGYVASVDQSTSAGRPGEADLVLRVPVAHVQEAMIKLAALGTVLDQHISIVDLNRVVAVQRQQILQLRLEIARITAALQQSLPADVRIRLEFQLQAAKQNLANVTGTNAKTLREAALSRIALTLTTQRAIAAAKPHHRGRVGRATHAAVSFLAGAGAIALAALIVSSPLIVLAALWFFGLRAYRRREEQRLLATR